MFDFPLDVEHSETMTIPIKGPSKAASGKTGQSDELIGSLIQYDDEGTVMLGVVTGTKKDKYLVLNLRGREIEMQRGRLYLLPGREPTGLSSTVGRVEMLTRLAASTEQLVSDADVAELWSFVHEDHRSFSVHELCESYFGEDSLGHHIALRNALIRERIHFKRDKEGFEPRGREVVEDLKRADEVKRKKGALREATVAFIEQCRGRHESLTEVPREIQDNLRLMAEIAAVVPHTDPARQKEGKDLVHICGQKFGLPENMPIEKQAFGILRKIGYFHQHTNLSFIRNDIPVAHPLEALREADALQVPQSIDEYPEHERGFRRDLTRLHVVTIDDASTEDMDDALSLEQTEDGFELGIHITDVSWAVLPETALDRSARRRATSLYCADQVVNMLPESSSEQSLSLRPGMVRPTISVLLKLSHDYQIVSSQLVPSFIKVAHRLSYDEVDSLLHAGEPMFLRLHEIAAACEDLRIRHGAIKVHKREVVPHLGADGKVWLQEIDDESPARSLVAEMMVLANAEIAEFFKVKGIPGSFRAQERPDEELPRDQDGEGNSGHSGTVEPPQAQQLRLKKSTVSCDPAPHAGLGLSCYLQATSPIRRYIDLCHQRQIISYLRTGTPWISREQFEAVAFEVENHLNSAAVASRETKRYWLLCYLEQRERGKVLQGTVVRTDTRHPLVELDEVYLRVFVRTPKPVKVDQRISIKVTSVDPHADYIRTEFLPAQA